MSIINNVKTRNMYLKGHDIDFKLTLGKYVTGIVNGISVFEVLIRPDGSTKKIYGDYKLHLLHLELLEVRDEIQSTI